MLVSLLCFIGSGKRAEQCLNWSTNMCTRILKTKGTCNVDYKVMCCNQDQETFNIAINMSEMLPTNY